MGYEASWSRFEVKDQVMMMHQCSLSLSMAKAWRQWSVVQHKAQQCR